MKQILIQGAMDIETDYLIEQLRQAPDYSEEKEYGLEFHLGTVGDKRFILSKTGMGTVKAAMATTYAIQKYHPTMVVNQGTAGGQLRELHTGDVIVVQKAVNINALVMPKKELGEGSDPFTWDGFHTTYYDADGALRDMFLSGQYRHGRMLKANAATGDLYSRESDRIIWLSEKFDTACEEMESAAVFEVCEAFATPCAGIRIISNNELHGEEFNEETGLLLQQYVWECLNQFL